MGFLRKDKKTFDPHVIAVQLIDAIEESEEENRGGIAIPSSARSAYGIKVQNYGLAATLLALGVLEQNYPRVSEIAASLREFMNVSQEDQQDFFNDLQKTVLSVAELMSPENKDRGMRWAREWLLSIGVEEHEPIKLQLFSSSWQFHYLAALKYITDVAKEYKL